MNTLRIAYRLTKKRKWSLFLLTVEIIICSIVILSTLGKIFYYFETKDLAYSFDGTYIIFHHIHTMMTFPLKSYLVKKVLKM